ncbi:MAG: MBL fold metallo-hydrolase, partial [Candidatus Thorarchaeota archaeon]
MSNESINIRTYNVGLGDAFLVSIPSVKGKKHLLVDFGSTRGKDKEYLSKVWDDIKGMVDDEPLAVILTHGHLDHFKGLYYFMDEMHEMASVFITTKHLRTKDTRRIATRDGPLLSHLDGTLG